MLIDRVRLQFKAGKGGSGAVHFDIMRKPAGGDGGHGGSIYVEGTNSIYDLSKLKNLKKIVSNDGERGGNVNKTGADGKDITVKLPVTTIIFKDDVPILTIDKVGQRELLAKGGRAGFGNYYFRRGQMETRNLFTEGKDGEEFEAILELRLKADVLFIGFPNAGKSSMLNMLTNAKSKVAPYPFTTLEPHLGVAENMILMDLPGFIEGVSEGKGVGKNFIKHFDTASVVCHFISLEEENLLENYKVIRKELKSLDPKIDELPELIILTKSDMFQESEIKQKLKQLAKVKSEKIVTSSFDFDNAHKIVETLKKYVQKYV